MLLHNYLDSSTYTENLLKSNLSEISDSEIKSIRKRVAFYVNHLKISTRKIYSESRERQLDFLTNLQSLLEGEISDRTPCYAYN